MVLTRSGNPGGGIPRLAASRVRSLSIPTYPNPDECDSSIRSVMGAPSRGLYTGVPSSPGVNPVRICAVLSSGTRSSTDSSRVMRPRWTCCRAEMLVRSLVQEAIHKVVERVYGVVESREVEPAENWCVMPN